MPYEYTKALNKIGIQTPVPQKKKKNPATSKRDYKP
jgi:hypothetical protein